MPGGFPILNRLGPFKGIDSRTAEIYMDPGNAPVNCSNADTERYGGGLTNAYGREQGYFLTALGVNLPIEHLVRYDVSTNNVYYIAQANSGSTAWWAPNANTVQRNITGITTKFSQGVQAAGRIWLNNGRQIYVNDGLLWSAAWQYPAPDGTQYAYSATLQNCGAGQGLATGTYDYAFVQVIEIPTDEGIIQQETTPTGALSPYPYTVDITAKDGSQEVLLTGVFGGFTADGLQFSTQIFRQSSTLAAWFLLTTTSAGSFVDNLADTAIDGNQQILLNQDAPPFDHTWPIAVYQDRTWVLARVQNAGTNNQPQTQLLYSVQGQPWSFNNVLQVQLVGDDQTTPNYQSGVAVPFGDQPSGLAATSSYLVVLKRQSCWLLAGNSQQTYQVVPFLSRIGMTAKLSLVQLGGIIGWLGSDGYFYTFDGASLNRISDKIWNDLQKISPGTLEGCVGGAADMTFFWSFPGSNVTYRYHLLTQNWARLPYDAAAFAYSDSVPCGIGQDGFKYNQLAAARTGTQWIDLWLAGKEQDLGGPIAVSWEGPWQDGGAPQMQKDFRYVGIEAPIQPGCSATVYLTIDGGTPQQFDFDLGVAVSQFQSVAQTPCLGYTSRLRVEFSTPQGATAPVQIWSVFTGGDPELREWVRPI